MAAVKAFNLEEDGHAKNSQCHVSDKNTLIWAHLFRKYIKTSLKQLECAMHPTKYLDTKVTPKMSAFIALDYKISN